MREAEADLFALHAMGTPVAVTTNGLLHRSGRAHLGAGCAMECGRRFPWFAGRLGALIASEGLRTTHVGERLLAFPVETSPYENPELAIILRSAHQLVALVDEQPWTEVALPRPGCGHGGLEWTEVSRVLAPLLDDRFVIVSRRES